MICTGETYKNVVKITLARGASLEPDYTEITPLLRTNSPANELSNWKFWCPGAESNHRHADFQSSQRNLGMLLSLLSLLKFQ
jgi:hypothetical protein